MILYQIEKNLNYAIVKPFKIDLKNKVRNERIEICDISDLRSGDCQENIHKKLQLDSTCGFPKSSLWET